MFPDKKKHNLKAVAKFGKGHVVDARDLNNQYADLLVPYKNKDGLTVFSILIRKFYQDQIERVFIQQYDERGNVEYLFYWANMTLMTLPPLTIYDVTFSTP